MIRYGQAAEIIDASCKTPRGLRLTVPDANTHQTASYRFLYLVDVSKPVTSCYYTCLLSLLSRANS